MTPDNVTLHSSIDVIGVLYHIELHQNRNAVFIWSLEMCFIFVEQINIIVMRPLYEAVILCDCIINEPGHEKTCLMSYANKKGPDQPAHPRSLISTFVVRCGDRMIPLVYISEISRF